MEEKSLGHGVKIPLSLWQGKITDFLTPDLVKLLSNLHKTLSTNRNELLLSRQTRQENFDQGNLPQYLNKSSSACSTDWKVRPVPADYQTRRVEITGPVNDAKMVINMLSRNESGARADTAMLDFEDSMKPSWNNVVDGIYNVIEASKGTLSFTKKATSKTPEKKYQLDKGDMAGMMVRVRGLHLSESNITVDDEPISAGLFDLVVTFYHSHNILMEQNKTPKYYIPKCEHHLEARWWETLFTNLEKSLNVPIGTLRCTFLIETLTAAFQIEEILYEIREHATGLNVGRWDKIFSDIKVLRNHPDRLSADRASINMSKFWMDNYAKRLIKICHSHGAFAIGGMSAFTPGKDETIRNEQTAKVRSDKNNEAEIGHDGCWVSHPYFIGIAMEAFTNNNQLERILTDFDKYPDLLMDGKGEQSLDGLKTNLRVGIAYLRGWNQNIGCVSWDNLMEDLATLEISRAQTWQWLHHNVQLTNGSNVSPDLIKQEFNNELNKILEEVDQTMKNSSTEEIDKVKQEFTIAKENAEVLFLKTELPDFLSLASDRVQ